MKPQTIVLRDWRVGRCDRHMQDEMYPADPEEWIPASVPGCVQYDLMRCQKLKNPYASTENARSAVWVVRSDWLYETHFHTPADADTYASICLRLWGIDTFSEVWLNGVYLGETGNAYRCYDFAVKKEQLTPADNCLRIRVKAHDRMIEKKREAAACLKRGEETEGLLGKSLIRRYQRNFFTESSLLNIGTGVLGIGIYRPAELCLYADVHVADVAYRTETIDQSEARGQVLLVLEGAAEGAVIEARIEDENGACVWEARQNADGPQQRLYTSVAEPQLWQPVGYGRPYLYTLQIVIKKDGEEQDRYVRKIGIRKAEVVQRTPEGKKTFFIRINGQKIMVKGENCIPLDYLKVYGTEEQYRSLFLLLEKQHVNLIRIWGGGAAEDEAFFEECDRRGILVWHDLFLHSNVYPDYDADFVQDFMEETAGILKGVRSHPCVCVLCGGNEQFEGWDEYGWQQELDRFYGSTLPLTHIPRLAQQLCPEIPYVPNSPYGGRFAQSAAEGDCHCWGNYYNAFKDPLFVTETCWTSESYSRPETLQKYMDLDADAFQGIGWGERWKERTSLSLIGRRPFSSWFAIGSLREYLHGLEVEQARADYHALSQLRFNSPSNSGIIYWSFNKGGPLFQFGCVDYDGRPMMSYYVVQRLYKDIAVFPYRDFQNVTIMLSNHRMNRASVAIEAIHLEGDGTIRRTYEAAAECEGGRTMQALILKDLYAGITDRTRETLFVRARVDGKIVSEDLLLFCPYGELDTDRKPLRAVAVQAGPEEWEMTLQAEGIVQMAEIESDVKIVCSDNYFPMMPGEQKTVRVTAAEAIDTEKQLAFYVRQLGETQAQCVVPEKTEQREE